jgi:hypothetical protein
MGNMVYIKYNLFSLKRRLELLKGKSYTWQEISHKTGVHFNTLHNIEGNKTRRLDLDIVAKLLDFFSREGMPVSIDQLFTVERSE